MTYDDWHDEHAKKYVAIIKKLERLIKASHTMTSSPI